MSTQQVSEACLAANRANAQRSTGPRTAEGKAAVSNNALKHGLRSERNPMDLAADAALPYEQTQFLETFQAFKEDLVPEGLLETRLVERLAQLDHRLQRAVRMDTAHLEMQAGLIYNSTGAALPDDEQTRNNWLSTLAFLKTPSASTLIAQYESRLSRDFARTLTQFRQAQKLRAQEVQKLRKQTQAIIQRSQHPGTGSSVPSEMNSTSSNETPHARVDIGACPSTDAQAPMSEISAEQTQSHPTATTPKPCRVSDDPVAIRIVANSAEQTQPPCTPSDPQPIPLL